jgi:hypothetical protein
MTPSSLSSTHHGHIHTTFPLSQNSTTHPLHPLLPRHPSLPVHPLPLWRAPWNPTTSPGKLFPIKHNSSRTRLHPRKRTCLNHNVKRGSTALHSEFFGPCHYPDHSGTLHHHHHQHQHHVARHKYLRTVLRSRGDVSHWHHSRPTPLHKSTFRILLYRFFRHFFSSPLFCYHCSDILTSHSRIISFAHCYLSSILSHLMISIVVCLKLKSPADIGIAKSIVI